MHGCKSIAKFIEKLKIHEKLFNASKNGKPNIDKKFEDRTHNTKFDHKRVSNPQPACFACGVKSRKINQCVNKERGKQCYGCKNFGHVHANCPKNSRSSRSTFEHKTNIPVDRTIHPISVKTQSQHPMHIPVIVAGIQLTELCDTGSQATIINETTYRKIGSPPLYPSQITFSGIGRDRVQSIGFFSPKIPFEFKIYHSLLKLMYLEMMLFPLKQLLVLTFCSKLNQDVIPSLHSEKMEFDCVTMMIMMIL